MNITDTFTESSAADELSETPTVIDGEVRPEKPLAPEELIFQLGLWLSGLESFLNLHNSTLSKDRYLIHDWSREFRVTHSVLLQCSKFTLDLLNLVTSETSSRTADDEIELIDNLDSHRNLSEFSEDEVFDLASALKESVLLSERLMRAKPLGFDDWTVWNNTLTDQIKNVKVVQKLVDAAEKEAGESLPAAIKQSLSEKTVPSGLEAELKLVLPYFARILRWLSVVGKMLEDDRPLKRSLLLFARINEQMRELMDYINNRLMRYPDEEDEFFGSMDSAAYTASIELRKVYDQELKELIAVRPAPLVYAKIENSYCLLNDSLQMTLVSFAKLVDPDIEPYEVFPVLREKEEQSITLRESMWNLLQAVQEAEKDPETYPIDELRSQLTEFSEETIGFIFYKDVETVERFIEEVMLEKENKDLVPILHRFGAYLETLLGQINMRVVLANQPFEPLEIDPQNMFG